MNRHFEDSRYYLKRAAETARVGLAEELEAAEARLRELTGREAEPAYDSRLAEVRTELTRLAGQTEGEARVAIETARERLDAYRAERAAPEQ